MLSVVVPTYNEAENLPRLAEALAQVLDGVEYELLIADDRSADDTFQVLKGLTGQYPIRLISVGDRPRDLSLSVIDGVNAAKYDLVLVMDADLSHPPEVVLSMLEAIRKEPGCFVLGSRYAEGGSFDRGWSLWRFVNSYVATMIARPLVSCGDPMSGFFLFDRRNVDLQKLKPIGYKIGLELMVRGNFVELVEIPILFKDREIGESKMNLQQQIKYLRHIRRLYLHKFGNLAEFVHFGAVGASGFLIDITFYFLFQFVGFNHVSARAMSFWPAVSWNWALNRMTTFGERQKRPKARQWFEFVASSLFGFAINWGIYTYLTSNTGFFEDYKVLALMTGIVCASFFNFAAASLFVYSDKRYLGIKKSENKKSGGK
ncbi:MAG: dolichol-phosphate mannosyltransferase [Candidatus Azotimanducaceae bacterium]